MDKQIYQKAVKLLEDIYGPEASFREGQYEAIEACVNNKRTLVVQKTGWGKSLVYFISAKMIEGVTFIISPLLVLMDNQCEFAARIGLKCGILNSTIKDREERINILERLRSGEYDVFFTTPETLFSNDMQQIISDINIGLFVVDECHCISDWGHDFRIEYGRLNKIIKQLPPNVNVLGTTATANDRVVADLKKQFGEDVYVSRGSLIREKLHIEILKLEKKAERYAWLKENINKLPGSGIIYCLTRRDCQRLSEYLSNIGITARPYYSDNKMDEMNLETEKLFMSDRIKVIVATIKLGMGYDKPNIRFIIHFQQPSSIVAYYQQIGRAGRDGKDAYCYMMTGKEDKEISNYFIEKAFPTEYQELKIIHALDNAENGLGRNSLMEISNISGNALDKTLTMLSNWEMIYRDNHDRKYYRTPKPYIYNENYYEEIKKVKKQELKTMLNYANEKGCLSKYIITELNDASAEECGVCANCMGKGIFEGITVPNQKLVDEIGQILSCDYIDIEPRKRWPYKNGFDSNIWISQPNEEGVALSKYGDEGWGKMVAYDKYHSEEFRMELVEKAVKVIHEKFGNYNIKAVTCVPSKRNKKVEVFARKVAERIGVLYLDILEKNSMDEAPQQKTMENSYFQCKNIIDTMKIKKDIHLNGNIILIDDIVDSKWTLTVCGRLLRKIGAEKVFPFCLADSSEVLGD